MALSLWDHEQRLLDLEHALRGTLEALLPDADRRETLATAAQRLRAQGRHGAAALLLGSASRSHAR